VRCVQTRIGIPARRMVPVVPVPVLVVAAVWLTRAVEEVEDGEGDGDGGWSAECEE
jgi:hypothetical protein